MSDEIQVIQFPNGLRAALKEIHSAPLISHWVWYRVGGRWEQAGRTGLSHWVEHMQFKGTPQFPAGVLDQAVAREGGTWNAFTHLDWTAYYETLPADKIDLALRLEADRMVNSLFAPEEVESERTVILSELEGSLNEPMFRLDLAIQEAAFHQHPYRNEVIGTPDDLRAIQRGDLYAHYRRYYAPNNALVTLAGDFDSAEMIQRLGEAYGGLPPAEVPELRLSPEPEPQGEQRVEISGPERTTYLRISYRAPAASQADFLTLSVVDSLLSGPSSLNMFGGGGVSNKTSRLYRAVVEQELAVSLQGSLQATADPFLYHLTALVRPESSPEAVLARVDEAVARLQNQLVDETEIRRAIKQARALFAYGSENITNQAFWLGYAEMFDRYAWFVNYLPALESVTPADVQRAAQTWLSPQRRVVGIYRPESAGGAA